VYCNGDGQMHCQSLQNITGCRVLLAEQVIMKTRNDLISTAYMRWSCTVWDFLTLGRICEQEVVLLIRWCDCRIRIFERLLLYNKINRKTHSPLVTSYGAPFVKALYLTDLAQKLLSLRVFSYLCTEIAKCVQI